MPAMRDDVLGAVADLRTRMTTPSTLELFDWVTGRRALRGEVDQRGGSAPWFGLEPVLRGLADDGLIEIGRTITPQLLPTAGPRSATQQVLPRVRLTDAGHRVLQR